MSCCFLIFFAGYVEHSLGGLCVFFFQAEDGIRDLVRSRGLGDVYKRQLMEMVLNTYTAVLHREDDLYVAECTEVGTVSQGTVSYTHLTLPTSDLV